MEKKALIIVDYQYDFANPNGSLYWPDGEMLREGILKKIEEYKTKGDLVVMTMDWHPKDHCSFKQWPPHCIQNTKGAQLLIDEKLADLIVKKAVYQDRDSYSAFNQQIIGVLPLETWLKQKNVNKIEICGLVKQYCVEETHKDALLHGFQSTILEELVK